MEGADGGVERTENPQSPRTYLRSEDREANSHQRGFARKTNSVEEKSSVRPSIVGCFRFFCDQKFECSLDSQLFLEKCRTRLRSVEKEGGTKMAGMREKALDVIGPTEFFLPQGQLALLSLVGGQHTQRPKNGGAAEGHLTLASLDRVGFFTHLNCGFGCRSVDDGGPTCPREISKQNSHRFPQ